MADLTIPAAYCPNCKDDGPVVVEDIDLDGLGEQLTIIYCPGCECIINASDDIEVKYYSEEELERATGWRVSNE